MSSGRNFWPDVLVRSWPSLMWPAGQDWTSRLVPVGRVRRPVVPYYLRPGTMDRAQHRLFGYFLYQKYCYCESTVMTHCLAGWRVMLAGSQFLHKAN